MYNFGVVVDDSSMGITHVLRAQDPSFLQLLWLAVTSRPQNLR